MVLVFLEFTILTPQRLILPYIYYAFCVIDLFSFMISFLVHTLLSWRMRFCVPSNQSPAWGALKKSASGGGPPGSFLIIFSQVRVLNLVVDDARCRSQAMESAAACKSSAAAAAAAASAPVRAGPKVAQIATIFQQSPSKEVADPVPPVAPRTTSLEASATAGNGTTPGSQSSQRFNVARALFEKLGEQVTDSSVNCFFTRFIK